VSAHRFKSRVEAQASAEGFADVEEYLLWLVDGTDYTTPPQRTVNSDEEVEALLLERIDGPSIKLWS
jgi:hypothetical protein